LFKVIIIRRFYRYLSYFELIRMLVTEGGLVVWMLYGDILYFSQDNDCGKYEKT